MRGATLTRIMGEEVHMTETEKEFFKSVTGMIEEVKEDMCNHYCKYSAAPIPEGRTEDWLLEDEDSPCNKCPLNRL